MNETRATIPGHVAALTTFFLLSSGLEACSAAASEPDKPSQSATRVAVDQTGFNPASIEAQPGPLTIVFRRTADVACAQEVVFPERKIRHALPLDQDVKVRLTVKEKETIRFTCGMGMLEGKIVAMGSSAHSL